MNLCLKKFIEEDRIYKLEDVGSKNINMNATSSCYYSSHFFQILNIMLCIIKSILILV